MKPKLLILTTTFPRWKNDPDPPFVFELARRLTSTFEVTVHTPHYPGAKTQEVIDNVRILRFRYFLGPFEKLAGNTGILPTINRNKLYAFLVPFLLVSQISSLIFLLFSFKPEVIHAHWVIPQGLSAAIAKQFFKTPYVVTAHGADIFSLQGKFFQWLKRLVVNKANEVTAVSQSLASFINSSLEAPVDKVRILPMGVSSDLFSPAARDTELRRKFHIDGPFLLYVGRLSEKKGVIYLVHAMKKILDTVPNASLLLVGHGELTGELYQEVKELKIEHRVFFVGPVPNQDLPPYFATADIFIGPSIQTKEGDTEGFGLTFVEAAMSGCLLIGTKVGGIRDIITDNETGLLVAEKDSSALADKIIYALQNQHQVELIRKNGHEKCIRLFDWQVVAEKYADLLVAAMQSDKKQ